MEASSCEINYIYPPNDSPTKRSSVLNLRRANKKWVSILRFSNIQAVEKSISQNPEIVNKVHPEVL